MATALACVAATPPADAAPRCHIWHNETVVVRSRAAVVTSDGAAWRGCLFSSGKPHRLFKTNDDGYPYSITRPSNFVLAGHFVAFAVTQTDHYNAQSMGLIAVDLKSGRRGPGATAGFSTGDLGGGDRLVLERLVLSPRGWFAWRLRHETFYPGAGEPEQRVELNDGRGQRLLASGPIGSLGGPSFVRPSRVAWSQDGVRHTTAARRR